MLVPMKISPAISTSAKTNMPTLLGFFDSLSCTECLAGGAIGGAVVDPAVGADAVAIRLLSLNKFGQLGTRGHQATKGWVGYTRLLLQRDEYAEGAV
jgi:hypothetical protein